uniref:Uncharacterized protein n=1 Tax=Anguilla anguilla TaxID=7936 RepID=A0A0E9PEV4_ANGAN
MCSHNIFINSKANQVVRSFLPDTCNNYRTNNIIMGLISINDI